MYINTFKYKPEDVSCVLCTEYVKKLGCTALSCPCLAERMEAGTVGYAEAVAELFPYRPRLTARIMRLAESFPGTMWQDNAHRKRMETLLFVKLNNGSQKKTKDLHIIRIVSMQAYM